MERKYNDLIGDILKEAEEKDNYKGKGKPISKEYLEIDTYQRFQKIASDAGFLPPWLKLQKEISQLVHSCKTEQDVIVINEKISKHNRICPSPMLKNQINLDELEKAKKIW
ncbi:DnaJ family domain-containing protein [Bacillus sp. SM2101]|uniref:DnaJ family domain-containing protein n=1 Tax=Bacillus sp. SM2101 TaxID=2805366 RepID=UPI001BDF6FAB|nr:DnaJ family domain-containing protein [Bacillus sp. SM2101]